MAGGLAFSQLVTLYVTPVAYTNFDEFMHRLRRRRDAVATEPVTRPAFRAVS